MSATAVSHVFAGIATADFPAALAWYERFFDRPPDRRPHDAEAVWGLADGGLVYVVADAERAGRGLVTLIVADLDAWCARLTRLGLHLGPVERPASGVRKSSVLDLDGNQIGLGQVSPPER